MWPSSRKRCSHRFSYQTPNRLDDGGAPNGPSRGCVSPCGLLPSVARAFVQGVTTRARRTTWEERPPYVRGRSPTQPFQPQLGKQQLSVAGSRPLLRSCEARSDGVNELSGAPLGLVHQDRGRLLRGRWHSRDLLISCGDARAASVLSSDRRPTARVAIAPARHIAARRQSTDRSLEVEQFPFSSAGATRERGAGLTRRRACASVCQRSFR